MKLLSLLGGEELAASTFKRAGDAWNFKTPVFRKLIGLAPVYRVNEAQKAELVALYMRTWRVSMLAVFVIIVAMLAIESFFPLGPTNQLLVSVAAGFAVGLPIWAWYGLALRPRLAGATPTSDPISQADQYRAMADNMSYTKLYVFLGLFLLFIVGIVAVGTWDATSIAGLILFGGGALQYSYMLIRKFRAPRA